VGLVQGPWEKSDKVSGKDGTIRKAWCLACAFSLQYPAVLMESPCNMPDCRHGVNLTKVPLPVELCEPRSFLQRLTDSWGYLELLHAAANAT
jgi:hypothetical protein